MTSDKRINTGLRLTEELKKAVEKEAEKAGRNESDVMRVAIANEVLDE